MRAHYVTLRLAMDADFRKYLLEKARVTQAAIARQCDSNPATVNKVVKDTYPVIQERARQTRDRIRQAIADAVGVPVKKLWPGEMGTNGTRRRKK